MTQNLVAKFATANVVRLTNAVRPANAVRTANAVRMANAVRAPPFGQPGGSSVRLLHLTYIRSRHRPRLFDAYNTSPSFKILRFEKLILAFLRSCSKSLHLLSSVSSAVVVL